MKKRITALFLTLVMVLGLLPANVFADTIWENEPVSESTETVSIVPAESILSGSNV